MGLFPKKNDPIRDRSRALNAEISALETRIKKLNQQVQDSAGPRLRSTVYPGGTPAPTSGGEPVFEEVRQLTRSAEPAATPQHFNELGARKFDLWAVLTRFKKQMSARPATNPKLINYLAAGSIQGLRPLRYEKRVARNRFFAVVASLAILCLGLIFYWRSRHP